MRLNRAPLLRLGYRALRLGSADLESHATARRVLCPPADYAARPALYPEGALDRILSLSPWRDRDTEMALIEGKGGHHAASEALEIPDVVLAGAWLYRRGARTRVGHGDSRLMDDLPPRRDLPEAHMAATWTGADFFGNFMQDSLTLEMLPPEGAPRLGAPTKPYAHEAGYRALLDLPQPQMVGHARIGRLTLYRDFAQNALKVERYRRLRARLRAALGATQPPAGIFLRRGRAGEARELVNEAALAAVLARQGFDIIDPETLDPAEIARRALDAPIVVAVEGSHLAHAIYTLADTGAFLVIQPPQRFAMPYKEFADCMDMRFGFVLGRPSGDGFEVDLDEMKLMLDLLL